MNKLVRLELDAVEWSSLRVMGEIDEVWIPRAVERLVSAETEEPVLLAALAGELSAPARVEVADLLLEICNGYAHQSEVALGNEQLGDACRAAAGEGTWLMYGLRLEQDLSLRSLGLWLIRAADPNRDRAQRTIRHFAQDDPDEILREQAETALAPFEPGSGC